MSAFLFLYLAKETFIFSEAKGDSMVDAGIAEGNLLVIERNCPASEGDIVVALDQEQQNTPKKVRWLRQRRKVLYPCLRE